MKHFRMSLRFSILSLFLTLFVATILTIISVSTWRIYNSQLLISQQQMERVSSNVQQRLDIHLAPAESNAQLTVRLIENGIINPANQTQMIEFTEHLLSTTKNAAMAYFGDTVGNFIISRLEPDDSISSEVINRQVSPPTDTFYYRNHLGEIVKSASQKEIKYDPRARPWYKAAVAKGELTWSDAYVFFSGEVKSLGITAAAPVFIGGDLRGVVGIDIRLGKISEFLSDQVIGKNGIAFIVDDKGNIIAHPNLEQLQKREGGVPKLTNISEVPVNWMTDAYVQYQKNKANYFTYVFDDDNYLADFSRIRSFEDKSWMVAVVVPEDDFIGDLKQASLLTIEICLLILAIGVVLIMIFSRKISASLNQLVTDTQKIKDFELDETPPITSRIQEIEFLEEAISSMRVGLRSFQKYVPADLVRILIHEGEGAKLGGSRKNITIFFSDIKSFTSISEQMPPEALMHHLCDYFDALTNIIRFHRGTIDKYIGDAIMAFWGSPIDDEDQTKNACIAALKFQYELGLLNEEWAKEGKPPLPSRIGIHTGEAIVGNLGSSNRLNYTAIGDTINLGSRLEAINSVYNTKIIVSEDVKKAVGDAFILRKLDLISVKGKSEPTMIYELVAEKSADTSGELAAYCAQYEPAFAAYENQQWDEAYQLYDAILKQHPDDTIARLFTLRCRKFKKSPPLGDWDGVWHYQSKTGGGKLSEE